MTRINSMYLFLLPVLLMGVFLLPSAAQAGVITKPINNLGLMGYWTFDDTENDGVATDYSGNGYDGTVTNFTESSNHVAGYKTGSSAIDLDGYNDHIYPAGFPNLTDDITINLWVNIDRTTNHIIGDSWNNSYEGYYRLTSSGGKIYLGHKDSGIVSHLYATDNTVISTDEWTHIAVTHTFGTGSAITIYINGEAVPGSWIAGNGNSDTYCGASQCRLELGHWYNTPAGTSDGYRLDGSLDDVRIYNRKLSADEISSLYNQNKATYKAIDKTNLVGYWSFEDATGTVATDFSGNGNSGTLTNMDNTDWVTGKIGTALDFDGVNDYVDLGDHDDFTPTSSGFTVSAWAKADSFEDTGSQVRAPIVSKSPLSGSGQWSIVLGFNDFDTTSPRPMMLTVTAAGSILSIAEGTEIISTDTWYHIVGTVDSSGVSRVYLNGVLSDTGGSASLPSNTTESLVFGADYGSSNRWDFDGKIDDVRIYNTALSTAEVAAIYNETKPTYVGKSNHANVLTDNLVGYWNFDGQNLRGTTAKDSSGNNHHGTINGARPAIGVKGQGIEFDGNSGSYITVPDSTDFTLAVDMTYSAWIKPDAQSGSQNVIFETYNGGNGYYFALESAAAKRPIVYMNGGWRYNSGGGVTHPGPWQHIVYVKDGTSGQVYIDGVAQGTFSGHTETSGNGGDLNIGSDRGSYHFNGVMDEVRIYNTALSGAQVLELYNATK